MSPKQTSEPVRAEFDYDARIVFGSDEPDLETMELSGFQNLGQSSDLYAGDINILPRKPLPDLIERYRLQEAEDFPESFTAIDDHARQTMGQHYEVFRHQDYRFPLPKERLQIRTRPDMLDEQADVDDPQQEWGSYLLHRDPAETEQKLRSTLENKRKWKGTDGGQGVVALSFSTDCYQDAECAETTRRCVEALLDHQKPVRILTRNPQFAAQKHLDLYTRGAEEGLVTFGTSLPSLNEAEVAAIEPSAPGPEARLNGLRTLSEAGVPVFVSMSPTYPSQPPKALRTLLRLFRDVLPTLDVVFHEAINPRGANFQMTVDAAREAGEDHLADQLEVLSDREVWREYAVSHLRSVWESANDLGVDVKLWPGDLLVRETEGSDDGAWVSRQQTRSSPEDFPEGV